MGKLIRTVLVSMLLVVSTFGQQANQQQQNMRVPKKPEIDLGLRWETSNGDRVSSKGTLTLSGPDGKLLWSGKIGKVPQIPFDAGNMPTGVYTITVQAPESEDYPALNWTWSFSHLAADARAAENYSFLVVFDASGRHGQVSFLAVERF